MAFDAALSNSRTSSSVSYYGSYVPGSPSYDGSPGGGKPTHRPVCSHRTTKTILWVLIRKRGLFRLQIKAEEQVMMPHVEVTVDDSPSTSGRVPCLWQSRCGPATGEMGDAYCERLGKSRTLLARRVGFPACSAYSAVWEVNPFAVKLLGRSQSSAGTPGRSCIAPALLRDFGFRPSFGLRLVSPELHAKGLQSLNRGMRGIRENRRAELFRVFRVFRGFP